MGLGDLQSHRLRVLVVGLDFVYMLMVCRFFLGRSEIGMLWMECDSLDRPLQLHSVDAGAWFLAES